MGTRMWSWGVALAAAGCASAGDAAPAARPGNAVLEPVELPADPDETAAIRAHTTDPVYLTPLIRSLPEHPTVPSPRDFLGYTIGTPQQCTHAAKIHAYYRKLAETSDRVQLFESGKSQEGRETLTIAIAEPHLLEGLEANVERLQRLGDGRLQFDAEALIASTVPVYWVTAGLHSTELGPPEVAVETAYRLAVSETAAIRAIRRGVITLITPVLEADGRERQVDWYLRHVKGYTNRNDMPPRSPPFWGHYSFHDNNRDAVMLSQPATRNYLATYMRFRPTVSLDMHESVPLLYVSMGTGPYNPVIDPITQHEWQWMSAHEISVLSGLGLPGVWTWGFYTGWAPSYLLWVTNLRNSCGRFYETFGNGTADTQERRLTEDTYAGLAVTKRSWYRGEPPPKTLKWSMRDNVNYMESALLTSLQFVATHGDTFLRNHRRKALNAIARGKSEKPYAYVIRATQRDWRATQDLLRVLLRHGLEVHQLGADFVPAPADPATDDDAARKKRTLSKDAFVIRCDQPWRPLVNVLLGVQQFPKDAPYPPYDDVGWTLGLMMGVDVVPVGDAAVLDAPMQRLTTVPVSHVIAAGVPDGTRHVYVAVRTGTRDVGPFCFAPKPEKIFAAAAPIPHGNGHLPVGTLLIPVVGGGSPELEAAQIKAGLTFLSLPRMPDVPMHEIDLPRIAVFSTWFHTQDTGWLRYALDHFGVPYTLITKEDVQGGGLKSKFDVILVANNGGSLPRYVHGIPAKWGPMAYTQTDAFPSHGRIMHSPDITGGLRFDGLAKLQRFVTDGGTLVTLGAGAVLACDSGIAPGVRLARGGGPLPGSILRAKVRRRDHPLTYGYADVTHLFRANVPGFSVSRYDERFTVMQWGTKPPYPPDDDAAAAAAKKAAGKAGPLVLSGGFKGFEKIDGKPAVLDVPNGKGHVVLIGPAVTRRFQDHQDFPLLWNALLHWNDFPRPDPDSEPRKPR